MEVSNESELYMLVELGAIKERAWLKDFKQKSIIEKNGWKFDFLKRCSTWVKKGDRENDTRIEDTADMV